MVRKAITELYLNVKIRSQEEITKMNEEAMELEKKLILDPWKAEIKPMLQKEI